MRFPIHLALLASGGLCSLLPFHTGQEILTGAKAIGAREKVPGDNPAYYSRIPKDEQIFQIQELIISPGPEHISANTSRLFTYLRGFIPSSPFISVSPSILDFATLTMTATVDGTTYEITEKISEHSVFSVRREGAFGEPRHYGGPLLEGTNELVGDGEVGHSGEGKRAKVRVEAIARLPCQTILFAIEADVEVPI